MSTVIANVNGISLYYETSGNGAPMLLLHGNGEDHHIFDVLVKKLKSNFTIYAIDSRNHGQSERTNDYSYNTMAEDVSSFIEVMRLGRTNIIGFSDGAVIGLILAMKYRDLLRRIALLGVNLKPDDFTEESYQYVEGMYKETQDPLFKLMLEQPNIELDAVKSVCIPTLLIAAEKDIYKPETFVNLLEALPDATLKIMKNHEHDSYIVGQDILYSDFIHFFRQSNC